MDGNIKEVNTFITIIMPVYNAEDYLIESITSILNQTYNNFEFIIIDDGSTDNSSKIISSFSDPRIRLIKNNVNIGIFKTRIRGIENASGEYIFWMDADDISMQNRIEEQMKVFSSDPNIIICGSDADIINSIGEVVLRANKTNHLSFVNDQFFFNFPFYNSTVGFKYSIASSCIEKLKSIFGIIQAEDYVLYALMLPFGKFVNISNRLLQYRVFESQSKITSNRNRLDIYNGRVAAWKIILDCLKTEHPSLMIFSIHDKLTYYPELLTADEIKNLDSYFQFLMDLDKNNIRIMLFDQKIFHKNILHRFYTVLTTKSISISNRKKLNKKYIHHFSLKDQIKLLVRIYLNDIIDRRLVLLN